MKINNLHGIRGAKIAFIIIPSIYLIMNFIIVLFGYNIIIANGPHILFFGIILFLAFIAFVSIRSWRKKWEFFVEIGIENVIKEANFLHKFRNYSIPLLIMLLLVYFLGGDHINKFYSLMYFDYRKLSLFQNIIRILIMPLYIITYAVIIKNLSFNRHRFFLAKGCAILFSEKRDTIDKMIYLTMCLSFYNKYLQKRINLRINGVEKISSKTAASIPPQKNTLQDGNNPSNTNNTSLESISLDLVKEFDREDDKLSPLRFLTNFLEKEEKIENLLVKETLSQEIQRNPIII
ncbi:MAG: hypothetical protein WAM14_12065, partial [Candidatus Nitrosopolaris sp.]